MSRRWRLAVLVSVATAVLSAPLRPQGLADAAVGGAVTRPSGEPVFQARVVLRNGSTGYTRELFTGSNGRFVFDAVPPGGPYELRALSVGFEPARSRAFALALGDRQRVDLAFTAQTATVLRTVEVREQPRAQVGGPSFAMSNELLHGLPLLNRNFTGLFATIPQAVNVGGTYSISGQLPALNAIQIDGGIASDVYGVSRTPGEGAGAKSISLEALDQIQVLVAPLDVRQGSFSGGFINAITRSGTNEWKATLFTSAQDQTFVGKDTAGLPAHEFRVIQYGATLGGPLVRDKLHLFVAADLQRSRTPFVGKEVTDSTTGISVETANRAAVAFRNVYGFDPGGWEAPVISQPDRSLFAKLTWQPASGHRVELSHNWLDSWQDALIRGIADFNPTRPSGWALSGSGMVTSAVVHTTRLRATSSVGPFTNELAGGTQTTDEDHASNLRTPLFLVQGDAVGKYVAGGSVANATATILDQRMTEVTDNVTLPLGSHELSAGAHAEWYRFTDNLFPNSWGTWRFPSVAAFEQRQPDLYVVALPLRPGGPVGEFGSGQAALYLQDRWMPVERLTVTVGLRADRPYSDPAPDNPALDSSATLGGAYSRRFSAATQLSPRLGFSWRATDRHALVIRGGVGAFTARAPQVWLGGEFTTTGSDQATLMCAVKDGVPAPVVDIDHLPQACTKSGIGTKTTTATYATNDFRSPEVWKTVAGIDARLAWSTLISVDVVRTDARYEPYLRDVNLTLVGTSAEGRAMYGRGVSGAKLIPSRRDPAFGQVFEFSSRGGDHATALSVSAGKQWSNGSFAQIGYQWSHAVDVLTLTNPGAMMMFQNNPLDGTIDARRQTVSRDDIPHSLVASAMTRLPFAVQASFLLRAQSGRPFAYIVNGDANGDGVSNDLFYVPRDSTDILLTSPERWGELDQYIRSHACLQEQRGRVMSRSSCRNPALVTLDGRLAKTVSFGAGQRMEIGVDFFNIPNLLNHRWGVVRETAANQTFALVRVDGWDTAANRPRYEVDDGPIPVSNTALVDPSRWKVQLGARYWPR